MFSFFQPTAMFNLQDGDQGRTARSCTSEGFFTRSHTHKDRRRIRYEPGLSADRSESNKSDRQRIDSYTETCRAQDIKHRFSLWKKNVWRFPSASTGGRSSRFHSAEPRSSFLTFIVTKPSKLQGHFLSLIPLGSAHWSHFFFNLGFDFQLWKQNDRSDCCNRYILSCYKSWCLHACYIYFFDWLSL